MKPPVEWAGCLFGHFRPARSLVLITHIIIAKGSPVKRFFSGIGPPPPNRSRAPRPAVLEPAPRPGSRDPLTDARQSTTPTYPRTHARAPAPPSPSHPRRQCVPPQVGRSPSAPAGLDAAPAAAVPRSPGRRATVTGAGTRTAARTRPGRRSTPAAVHRGGICTRRRPGVIRFGYSTGLPARFPDPHRPATGPSQAISGPSARPIRENQRPTGLLARHQPGRRVHSRPHGPPQRCSAALMLPSPAPSGSDQPRSALHHRLTNPT